MGTLDGYVGSRPSRGGGCGVTGRVRDSGTKGSPYFHKGILSLGSGLTSRGKRKGPKRFFSSRMGVVDDDLILHRPTGITLLPMDRGLLGFTGHSYR